MNKILFELILDACVSTSACPDKLIMEHVMLLSILHNHVGTEVGKCYVTMVTVAVTTSREMLGGENQKIHYVRNALQSD